VNRAEEGLGEALGNSRLPEALKREVAALLPSNAQERTDSILNSNNIIYPPITSNNNITRMFKDQEAKMATNARFLSACREGRVEEVWACLQQGAAVACLPSEEADARNGLILAVLGGHLRVVDLLLAVPGVDLNHTDQGGRTVLHHAVEQVLHLQHKT